MDRDDHLARLTAHSADCAECENAPLPLDRIAAVLEATVPAIDAAALSRQTFAQLQPELQHRALAVGWRRMVVGVLLSLLPLPLVLAYNAYLLRMGYDLLSSLLPAAIAAYLLVTRRGILDPLLPVFRAQLACYAIAFSVSSFDPMYAIDGAFGRIAMSLFPAFALVPCGRAVAFPART